MDSETERALMTVPPPVSGSGAGYHEVVLAWLRELGLEAGTESQNAGVPVSVIVFCDHDDPDRPVFYAVPDDRFAQPIRDALAKMHGSVFTREDIADDEGAGGLWLLALIKKVWIDELEHFLQLVPSIDRDELLRARRDGIWDEHSVGDDGGLREATITHCYAMTLAH